MTMLLGEIVNNIYYLLTNQYLKSEEFKLVLNDYNQTVDQLNFVKSYLIKKSNCDKEQIDIAFNHLNINLEFKNYYPQQLTVDYGTDFFTDNQICNCKTPSCKYNQQINESNYDLDEPMSIVSNIEQNENVDESNYDNGQIDDLDDFNEDVRPQPTTRTAAQRKLFNTMVSIFF